MADDESVFLFHEQLGDLEMKKGKAGVSRALVGAVILILIVTASLTVATQEVLSSHQKTEKLTTSIVYSETRISTSVVTTTEIQIVTVTSSASQNNANSTLESTSKSASSYSNSSTSFSSSIGPVTYTQFVSLWQALSVALGADRNYTTLPQNISARLDLYEFRYVGFGDGTGEASSSMTNIPYDQVTGLPVQTILEEPYLDGLVVVTNVTLPSCVMYMLIWTFDYPSPHPGGGESSISAITGEYVGDVSSLTMSMISNCPSASGSSTSIQTITTVSTNVVSNSTNVPVS